MSRADVLAQASAELRVAVSAVIAAATAFNEAAHAAAGFDDKAYADSLWAFLALFKAEALDASSSMSGELKTEVYRIEMTMLRSLVRFIKGTSFADRPAEDFKRAAMILALAERGIELGGLEPLKEAMAEDSRKANAEHDAVMAEIKANGDADVAKIVAEGGAIRERVRSMLTRLRGPRAKGQVKPD